MAVDDILVALRDPNNAKLYGGVHPRRIGNAQNMDANLTIDEFLALKCDAKTATAHGSEQRLKQRIAAARSAWNCTKSQITAHRSFAVGTNEKVHGDGVVGCVYFRRRITSAASPQIR